MILTVIFSGFVAVVTIVALVKVRVPGGVHAGRLGWMSERWLAEQRTSHPRYID